MKRVLALLALGTLLILAKVPTASANSITYSYTGNPFTNFFGTLPSGVSRISGSFTLSNPLGANFLGTVTPSTFSFSDGVTTLTQASVSSGFFNVGTDATGAIISWTIQLASLSGGSATFVDQVFVTASDIDASFNQLNFTTGNFVGRAFILGHPGLGLRRPNHRR